MTTDGSRSNHRDLILRCRQGDELALGQLLDQHRDWLRHVAATELNGRAPTRFDPSDIVQQTFLSAFRRFAQFEGSGSGEFAAWLKRIHERNIQDAIRRHRGAEMRDVAKERPLAGAHAVDTAAKIPGDQAIRNERSGRLSQHLESLPKDQAEAVRLRHLEGKSLAELAEHFDRSTDSVASLLKRGLENLRQRVRDE